MLIEFRIRNFALIDDATLAFGPGLNVLTGETGAGKSVIVTALSLVLGERAGGGVVREGCDAARTDALFACDNPALRALLHDAGVAPEEDDSLYLSREFAAAGRSTARLNNQAVPVSALKSAAERLADLHGQYAHQTLLRAPDHAAFLDAAGDPAHKKRLRDMADAYSELHAARARLREITENADRLREEAEMLRFRISEIAALIAKPEELEELLQEIRTLEHAEDLARAVNAAWESVSRNGADDSALNALAASLRALDDVAGLDPGLDAAAEQLREADAILDTTAHALGRLKDKYIHDPERLDQLQDRLFQIKNLMKKTGCADVHELFEYQRRALERLADAGLDEDGIARLRDHAAALEKQALAATAALTESRKKLAETFVKKMKKELKELAMPGAAFEAAMLPHEQGEPTAPGVILRDTGAERIEFRISANPGEAPQPLARIASGGELSRVMLAFQALLHGADAVPVLVFDEIDAGIGGETAHAVARKLAALSRSKQVIAVTHLPQIAAAADRHIAITKTKKSGRTIITAQPLDENTRILEMTRMLGATGMQESEDLAKKLIQQAKEFKK